MEKKIKKNYVFEYLKRPAKKQIVFAVSSSKFKPCFNKKSVHFSLYPSYDVVNCTRSSIMYKYSEEILEQANEKVLQQKKRKKRWFSFGFFMLNIAIIAGIFFYQSQTEEGLMSFTELFKSQAAWKYLFIAFALFFVEMFVDSLKYFVLIKKATNRSRKFLSYKVAALGKYYDAITPLGSGGQPFQIHYLNKRGIRGDKATSIPLVKFMIWQIAFSIISVVLLVTNYPLISSTDAFFVTFGWIGILANIVMLMTVFVLSVSRRVGPNICIWVLKALHKIKLIKNYQQAFRKVMRFVNSYQATLKDIVKDFWVMVWQLLLAVINIFIHASYAYFIYLTFNVGDIVSLSWIQVVALITICEQAVTFMPTPGAAGASELAFAAMFAMAFESSGVLFWAMLLWRILVYYGVIIQGAIIVSYDYLWGNKKAERLNEIGYWNDSKKEVGKMFFNKRRNKIPQNKLVVDINSNNTFRKYNTILVSGIIKQNRNDIRVNEAAQSVNKTLANKKFNQIDLAKKAQLEKDFECSMKEIAIAKEKLKEAKKVVAKIKKEEREIKKIEKEKLLEDKLKLKIEKEKRELIKKELEKKNKK